MPTVEDSKIGIFATPAPYSSGTTTDDPSQNRLQKAGLEKNGNAAGSSNTPGTVGFNNKVNDWRIRISVAADSGILYRDSNPGVMKYLKETDGVIFPYVPQITVGYNARYGSQQLTHTNYTNYFYEASEVQSIQISGDFAVQNDFDAQYFLGVLYFFRAATKMFYGNSGIYQGAPPPIIYLDGYGSHYLPHVPCILTQFSHTMPSDVDYLETEIRTKGQTTFIDSASKRSITAEEVAARQSKGQTGGFISTETVDISKTRLPTSSQINVTLQPVYSRTKQKEFDFNAFARGDLLSKGFL
jgi:hypothetical protein